MRIHELLIVSHDQYHRGFALLHNMAAASKYEILEEILLNFKIYTQYLHWNTF